MLQYAGLSEFDAAAEEEGKVRTCVEYCKK
jgi:hypothetical protein